VHFILAVIIVKQQWTKLHIIHTIIMVKIASNHYGTDIIIFNNLTIQTKKPKNLDSMSLPK
jgi:hypothetical protein